MAEWIIAPLDKSHDRTAFCSGKEALDDFLLRYVSQYKKRHLGRTYVAVQADDKLVCGYYTLATGAVEFKNLPEKVAKKLPKHPVPIILLARLAVDNRKKGLGLGGLLLRDALQRALSLADHLGIFAVIVEAIDEDAKAFYEKFGFEQLRDQPLQLMLTIETIESARE